MRSLRPRHLFGYSSALAAFARHVRAASGRDDGGAGHGVEVIFTTSEVLLPADRALLEAFVAVENVGRAGVVRRVDDRNVFDPR